MRRYQIYLDPNSVSILDDFGKVTNISRSKIVSEAIDRLADNIIKIFTVNKIASNKKYNFDKLIGIVNLKGKGQTNYAQKSDLDYLGV